MSDDTPPTAKPLTAKQRDFVEHYLDCLNATEAARRAGYKSPHPEGVRLLLRNATVRAAVDEGFKARAMGRDEVIARLGELARSDMRDFVTTDPITGEPQIVVSEDRPLHLVKRLKVTKSERAGEVIDTKIEIELYDAKAALDTLARHHRIVTPDAPGAVLTVTPEQLAAMSDAELDELARKRSLL